MNLSYHRWRRLFIFCLGLAIGTGFCMKWMESDFVVNGDTFSMLGLELFYPAQKVQAILSHIDQRTSTVLSYHLHFDFAFMAGIFPGISAICMMAREKVFSVLPKRLLFLLAVVQLLAWACDITENVYLINWLAKPLVGSEFAFYRFIVFTKWIVALIGFLFGGCVLVLGLIKTGRKVS